MQARQPDGCTLKENLEVVQKQGIAVPELENQPTLPEVFEEVWYWFLKLNSRRSSNGMGINPISYLELKAFFYLIDYKPSDWEIEAIELLDNLVLDEYSKQMQKENKKNNK